LPSKMTKDEFQDPGDHRGAYEKLHT